MHKLSNFVDWECKIGSSYDKTLQSINNVAIMGLEIGTIILRKVHFKFEWDMCWQNPFWNDEDWARRILELILVASMLDSRDGSKIFNTNYGKDQQE